MKQASAHAKVSARFALGSIARGGGTAEARRFFWWRHGGGPTAGAACRPSRGQILQKWRLGHSVAHLRPTNGLSRLRRALNGDKTARQGQ